MIDAPACRECGAVMVRPVAGDGKLACIDGHGVPAPEFDVVHADCLDPALGLPSFPDKSVDVCIMDPPYDANTHKKGRRGCTGYVEPTRPGAVKAQFNRARDLAFEPLSPELMAGAAREVARVVRRWTLVFCAIEMVSDWRRAFEDAGLEYVRTMIWRKKGSTPQFTGDRPAQAAECIVLAHPPGRKRWNGHGRHGWFDIEDPSLDLVYDHPIVLNRGKQQVRFHTAQKPIGLLRDLVTLFSDSREIVIDPFAGSGTAGVACAELGRSFVGWDLDAGHCEVARTRIAGALPPAEAIAAVVT